MAHAIDRVAGVLVRRRRLGIALVKLTLRVFEWRVRRLTVRLVRLTRERAEVVERMRSQALEPWLARLWEARAEALTARIAGLTRERAAADRARKAANTVLFHDGLGRTS